MCGGRRRSARALDDPGFDPSTLVYWRKRIAKSERPHRVNDAVKTVIGQTGILKGRRRRAVDSTILADAVATQDTVTQLVSRDPPGGAGGARRGGADRGGVHRARLLEAGQAEDRLGRPGRQGRAGVGAGQRRERAGGRVAGADLEEPAASAVALLALVAGQDVEPAEGSDGTDGRWRIARKVAEDRVISTVDPDARHTRKSPEARRDGYRAHVAAGPETGIITDEKLTRAAGQENSDPAVAEEFLAGEAAAAAPAGRALTGGAGSGDGGDDALAWYGDSAYGTGDLRDAIGRGRAPGGDQAQAGAARGRWRVHRR